MERITVNELFSGIGAQRKALENIGVEHEVVGISDIDKYANQSYNAIYGNTRQYGDITKIERLDYADLWTYSFPCQDISVAGNQKGINEHTRSGLLYEVQRLLEVAKTEDNLPKYLLLENVKNLVGKKFKPQFDDWISYLDELGYNTYWKVLNAKNYGIPQNRERVFGVSIRKDILKDFRFPEEQELKVRLLDILEPEVDESYYISDEKAQKLFKQISEKEVSNTIRTGGRGSIDRHTWDLVAVKEATEKGYATAGLGDSINIEQPNSKTRRGRVGKGCAQTLTTSPQQVVIAASRGRYKDDSTTEQKLELNSSDYTNTITTVQKDNLVIEKTITGAYNPYNKSEIKDVAPTQTTNCRGTTTSSSVLIAEDWAIYQRPRGNNKGGIKEIAPTVTSHFYEQNNLLIEGSIKQLPGNLYKNNPQAGRVYNPEGICPTLDTMQGGNRQPKVLIEGGAEHKPSPQIIDDTQGFDGVQVYNDVTPTLRANRSGLKVFENIRIRRLTPLECWRLMGFDDEDFYKAKNSGVSNTQLYRQAGNSIVVKVLERIFENLLKE